jgi:hypothetical protein
MLSVIVQSESEENSSKASSVHLPIENRDLSVAAPASRGNAEGPGRSLPERRLSLHRTNTSRSDGAHSGPGGRGATPPARNPKIILPQLGKLAFRFSIFEITEFPTVVRQPTNHSSLQVPSPIGETGTLNGALPKRTRPPLRVFSPSSYRPFP